MFHTIVVGTDGSTGAIEAIETAGRLAKALDVDAIHIVAACEPFIGAEVSQIEAALPQEFHDLISPHMRANKRFAEATNVLAPIGVKTINHEHAGNAAEAILDVAQAVEADLIVVGARGLGALSRFFRGSVSTKVAHHSPCNVLIVEHR